RSTPWRRIGQSRRCCRKTSRWPGDMYEHPTSEEPLMWSSMNNPRRGDVLAALAIAIAAAGTTYLFDSRSGRRRRALLRDRASRLTHQAREFVGKAGRDARQRAHGAYEKSVSRWRGGPIDAEVLRERVR